jgi:hypothetical protein
MPRSRIFWEGRDYSTSEHRASIDADEDNGATREGIVLLAGGGLLILTGLIAWLYDERLRDLKAWDRPRWTLHRVHRLAFSTLRRVCVIAGLLLLWSASTTTAIVVGAAILGGWARVRWVRTDRHAIRRLRTDLSTLRRRHPECDDRELLTRVVTAHHPGWGPELAQQIVTDNPELEDLARILNRMKQGWSALD